MKTNAEEALGPAPISPGRPSSGPPHFAKADLEGEEYAPAPAMETKQRFAQQNGWWAQKNMSDCVVFCCGYMWNNMML